MKGQKRPKECDAMSTDEIFAASLVRWITVNIFQVTYQSHRTRREKMVRNKQVLACFKLVFNLI